jgi:hypothetical protein
MTSVAETSHEQQLELQTRFAMSEYWSSCHVHDRNPHYRSFVALTAQQRWPHYRKTVDSYYRNTCRHTSGKKLLLMFKYNATTPTPLTTSPGASGKKQSLFQSYG